MNKYFRYLLSGYIFERRRIKKKLKRINGFIPTEKKYSLPKIVVYTVITGSYDSIIEPQYIDPLFDYIAFITDELQPNSIWMKREFPPHCSSLGLIEKSRYVKILPQSVFKDYDISIYIDGNITISRDIRPIIYSLIESQKVLALHKHSARDCIYDEGRIIWAQGRAKIKDILKQLWNYKREGFPKHFGLFENNIIIRFHNDPTCKAVMETWWQEFSTNATKRDQLSLSYSLWKNNLSLDFVMSLGSCSRNSPYFTVVNHSK